MAARRVSLALCVCGLLLCCGSAAGRERKLLYSKAVSDGLREVVKLIRDPRSSEAACRQAAWPPGYFLRVAPLGRVLDERSEVRGSAVLGAKPFVFITTPEGVCGLSLLEIYELIGYEAEGILKCQQDAGCAKDMVAVIFRYPADVSASEVKDGALPADWGKKVYATTWDNIFSLFTRLAEGAEIQPDRPKDDEFAPERTFFRSQAERYFVLGFPEEGRRKVRAVPYAALKDRAGADWAYRRMLEIKLSVFEHFRGDGRTWDEVRDPDGVGAGLAEFVGPNIKISALPELAVVHLGQLMITDTYSAR